MARASADVNTFTFRDPSSCFGEFSTLEEPLQERLRGVKASSGRAIPELLTDLRQRMQGSVHPSLLDTEFSVWLRERILDLVLTRGQLTVSDLVDSVADLYALEVEELIGLIRMVSCFKSIPRHTLEELQKGKLVLLVRDIAAGRVSVPQDFFRFRRIHRPISIPRLTKPFSFHIPVRQFNGMTPTLTDLMQHLESRQRYDVIFTADFKRKMQREDPEAGMQLARDNSAVFLPVNEAYLLQLPRDPRLFRVATVPVLLRPTLSEDGRRMVVSVEFVASTALYEEEEPLEGDEVGTETEALGRNGTTGLEVAVGGEAERQCRKAAAKERHERKMKRRKAVPDKKNPERPHREVSSPFPIPPVVGTPQEAVVWLQAHPVQVLNLSREFFFSLAVDCTEEWHQTFFEDNRERFPQEDVLYELEGIDGLPRCLDNFPEGFQPLLVRAEVNADGVVCLRLSFLRSSESFETELKNLLGGVGRLFVGLPEHPEEQRAFIGGRLEMMCQVAKNQETDLAAHLEFLRSHMDTVHASEVRRCSSLLELLEKGDLLQCVFEAVDPGQHEMAGKTVELTLTPGLEQRRFTAHKVKHFASQLETLTKAWQRMGAIRKGLTSSNVLQDAGEEGEQLMKSAVCQLIFQHECVMILQGARYLQDHILTILRCHTPSDYFQHLHHDEFRAVCWLLGADGQTVGLDFYSLFGPFRFPFGVADHPADVLSFRTLIALYQFSSVKPITSHEEYREKFFPLAGTKRLKQGAYDAVQLDSSWEPEEPLGDFQHLMGPESVGKTYAEFFKAQAKKKRTH